MGTPVPGDPSWRVTAQQQTVERMPDGTLERGWQITWTTGNNVTGSVFLPGDSAADENLVRAVIQEKVDAVYRRANLTG